MEIHNWIGYSPKADMTISVSLCRAHTKATCLDLNNGAIIYLSVEGMANHVHEIISQRVAGWTLFLFSRRLLVLSSVKFDLARSYCARLGQLLDINLNGLTLTRQISTCKMLLHQGYNVRGIVVL